MYSTYLSSCNFRSSHVKGEGEVRLQSTHTHPSQSPSHFLVFLPSTGMYFFYWKILCIVAIFPFSPASSHLLPPPPPTPSPPGFPAFHRHPITTSLGLSPLPIPIAFSTLQFSHFPPLTNVIFIPVLSCSGSPKLGSCPVFPMFLIRYSLCTLPLPFPQARVDAVQ